MNDHLLRSTTLKRSERVSGCVWEGFHLVVVA